MKLPRRKFLHLAAGATALPATSRIGWAQAYPSRPVRIVVAAAAGGPTDIVARLISQWFSDRIGQRLITQPKPTSLLPIQKYRRGYPLWALPCSPALPRTSESLLPKKPRNGAR